MERDIKRYVAPGETFEIQLPWSEVCMHMRVADKVMKVQLVGEEPYLGAQLLNPSGTKFSSAILPGEAGLYRDGDGYYYYAKISAVETAAA